MGFGDNTKASLITRGLAETARLGVALGADPLTFAGLAGLGDLVATCIVAAVAQPHLRRAARPRRDAGGGPGGHPADRRGREELPVDPGPRPRHGVDMPITEHVVRRLPRGQVARAMVRGADEPGNQAGVVRERPRVKASTNRVRRFHPKASMPARPRPHCRVTVPARAQRSPPSLPLGRPPPGAVGVDSLRAGPTAPPGDCWRRRSVTWKAAGA